MFVGNKLTFPDLESHGALGDVVAMGGHLNVANLREAYSKGIFPWPHEGFPMLWFSPERRGVLHLDRLRISRTNKKNLRRNIFSFSANQAFEDVIKKCQLQPRPGQNGTWITPEVISAYCQFHQEGYAHSIEVWENSQLVGGLYGVYCEGLFSAESMFFDKSNSSKLGFIKLSQFLYHKGLQFLDVQMVTEVSESFGAVYVGRSAFYRELREQRQRLRPLTRWGKFEFAHEFNQFVSEKPLGL
jgi:leucyl/phenylalanyl-tRNA--protein transferase